MNLQEQTRQHYQKAPFDWGQEKIRNNYLKYSGIGKFINKYLKRGNKEKTLDCGCGIGLISDELLKRGYDVISVDLTETSQKLAKRFYNINVVRASNLNLSFKDNTFDIVMSSGVVHHTPNTKRAVEELVRVLKSKGLLYLLIYRKPSIHYLERITTGALIRKIHKKNKWIIDNILVRLMIPLIYLGRALKFRTLKRASYQEYKNYFYDRFITPQAAFHTKKEVESWLRRIKIIDYWKGNFGYHHNFVGRKL